MLYFCYKSRPRHVLRHAKIYVYSLFASGRLNYIAFSGLFKDKSYRDFCMAMDSPAFILTLIKFSSVGSFAPPIPLSLLPSYIPFPPTLTVIPPELLEIADARRSVL